MSTDLSQFESLKKEFSTTPYQSKNISTPKSYTLNYIKYRLLRPFYKYRYKQYQKQKPTAPWLTPDAIKILNILLKKSFTALEYGSGRSTIFFSQRVDTLFSIEHNEEWYEVVKKSLKEKEIKGSHLMLIKPDLPLHDFHTSSEGEVFISEANYPNKDRFFQSYINFLDKFEDNFFDFIIVDGRARTSCSLKAINKLKPGGLMVLDNSERVRYNKVHKTLSIWPKIFTTTGLTDTSIWRKPDLPH